MSLAPTCLDLPSCRRIKPDAFALAAPVGVQPKRQFDYTPSGGRMRRLALQIQR
jgi:hypothetical protein